MPNLSPTADLMSPMTLFLQADVVVKIVMLGLLAASVWTWAIIFTHALRLRRINRQTEAYERDFWAASRPIITTFTTISAERNRASGDIMSAEFGTVIISLWFRWRGTPRPTRPAGGAACRRARGKRR